MGSMYQKAYSQKLRDPRWQRLRLKRLEESGWKCDHCGDSRSELQVHHKWYLKGMEPWDYAVHNLESLCVSCHEKAGKVHDEIKKQLSILITSYQERIAFLLSHHGQLTSFTRYGDPSTVNHRVAACYALAVSMEPLLAPAISEMHDHKGLLSVSVSRKITDEESVAIRWAWEEVGECPDCVSVDEVNCE